MKLQIIILCLITSLIIGCSGTSNYIYPPVMPDEFGEMPDIMVLSENGRKPSIFPHTNHVGRVGCEECHFDAARLLTVGKKYPHTICIGCHTKGDMGKKQTSKCSNCHLRTLRK